MAPKDTMMAQIDAFANYDTQRPEADEALEAPETAISLEDTGLITHSTRQLPCQHLHYPSL